MTDPAGDRPGLRLWIDATALDPEVTVFGMSPLERALRSALESGITFESVEIAAPREAPAPDLPAGLLRAIPLRWSRGDDAVGRRLAAAAAREPRRAILAIPGDAVVDARLVHHLAEAPGPRVFAAREGGRAAILRLDPGADVPADAADLWAVGEAALAAGRAARVREAEFDDYLVKLRRRLPPYLIPVPDRAASARAERFLFWSNYKGSTDFLTRHVYPPLVWALVRPLARRRVHPNWVTAASWVAAFACLPFFAAGAWVPGLALAYTMSVLDSVDGKLARLTYRSSRFGDVFDHGLDIVHPPFWYVSWALALAGGAVASGPVRAALGMTAFYVVDRVVAGVFKARVGVSIHGVTALDERVRTFVSRRNVNLAVFTVAVALDAVSGGRRWASAAFYAIVVWQVLSTGWHAQRLYRFWGAEGRPGLAGSMR